MKFLFKYAGGKFHLIRQVEQIYRNSNKTAFIDVFGGSVRVLMNIDYFITSFLILSILCIIFIILIGYWLFFNGFFCMS